MKHLLSAYIAVLPLALAATAEPQRSVTRENLPLFQGFQLQEEDTSAHEALVQAVPQPPSGLQADRMVALDLGALRSRIGAVEGIQVIRNSQVQAVPDNDASIALAPGDILAVRRGVSAERITVNDQVTVTASPTVFYTLDTAAAPAS